MGCWYWVLLFGGPKMFEQRIPRDIAIVIITGFTGRSFDGQEGSTGRKETGDRNAWGGLHAATDFLDCWICIMGSERVSFL